MKRGGSECETVKTSKKKKKTNDNNRLSTFAFEFLLFYFLFVIIRSLTDYIERNGILFFALKRRIGNQEGADFFMARREKYFVCCFGFACDACSYGLLEMVV